MPWHTYQSEVSRLAYWLEERGETVGWTATDWLGFMEKPWHWSSERALMLTEETARLHLEMTANSDAGRVAARTGV